MANKTAIAMRCAKSPVPGFLDARLNIGRLLLIVLLVLLTLSGLRAPPMIPIKNARTP